jgi:hypothetical protein
MTESLVRKVVENLQRLLGRSPDFGHTSQAYISAGAMTFEYARLVELGVQNYTPLHLSTSHSAARISSIYYNDANILLKISGVLQDNVLKHEC